MLDYSICKDRNPKETVKVIKKILANNGIQLQETITAEDINKNKLIPSVRVEIKNTNIGSNGKGTSIENAQASGYAEFMERIQNGFLLSLEIPDIVSSENGNNKKLSQLELVPFYGVKEKKIINLPRNLIRGLTGSNGLASGNTYEEALVQGISEICERYAKKQVIINNLSLPDIPEKMYMKYDRIKKIIKVFESYGYKVYVKDASIGKKIPVVCSVLVHEKENIMMIAFGSHPTFAVAVERTLTEMFQGKELDANTLAVNVMSREYCSKQKFNDKYKNDLENLSEFCFIYTPVFEINDYIKNQFVLKKSNFVFDRNVWIKDSFSYKNKELLKFLLNNIKDITNDNIYIRDVNFLGFPSIQVYIPKMSRYINIKSSDKKNLFNWMNFRLDSQEDCLEDINSLIAALELKERHFALIRGFEISIFPYEYLRLLCSIVVQDYNKAIECAEALIYYNKNLEFELLKNHKYLLELLVEYCKLKLKGLSEDEIIKNLEEKYDKEKISVLEKFLKNLTFDIIKKVILSNLPKERFPQGTNKELDIIRSHLSEMYKNNIPNQNHFGAFFNFLQN